MAPNSSTRYAVPAQSAGVAIDKAVVGQVPSEIDTLSNSVDVLEAYVQTLIDRLARYATTPGEQADGGVAADSPREIVEMAMRVSYQRARVDSVAGRVSDLLHRLEV